MLMIKIFTLFFLSLMLLSNNSNAQNEMLIEQLSGRTVIRENFNSDGTLISKQHFQISKIQESQGIYEIEIAVELFNENGESEDKYTTFFQCNYEEVSIMLLVIPFFNPTSKKTTIKTKSDNFIQLYNFDILEDIEVEISFDRGFLKVFGAKNAIKLYDRTYLSNGEINEIHSKLSINTYAFGLKIKNMDYDVVESFDNNKLVTFQTFVNSDESYFSMTYINDL